MSLSAHRELLVLSFIRDHAIHGYALAEALENGLEEVGSTEPVGGGEGL